ncbi:MAG: YggT family protein [Alphaproteobacteria bacterium]|nr:YggT family protein [Alphaproteobacteria bacterium]MDE2337597.1 YggT family protein [Alphaproteobacteria bacterium]
MDQIILLLVKILNVYLWLVIASVVASWLVAFDVLNMRNKWVYKALTMLNDVVNPGLRYIRKVVPPVGNIDFSPMAMLFLIYVVQNLLIGLLR